MEYLQLLLQGLQRAVDFASSFTTYLLGDDPHPGGEDPRNAKERRNDGNSHDCEVETTHDGTNISPREHLEIFGGPLTTEEIPPDLKIQVTLGAAVHGAPPTESIPELAKQSSTNEGWEDSEEKLSETCQIPSDAPEEMVATTVTGSIKETDLEGSSPPQGIHPWDAGGTTWTGAPEEEVQEEVADTKWELARPSGGDKQPRELSGEGGTNGGQERQLKEKMWNEDVQQETLVLAQVLGEQERELGKTAQTGRFQHEEAGKIMEGQQLESGKDQEELIKEQPYTLQVKVGIQQAMLGNVKTLGDQEGPLEDENKGGRSHQWEPKEKLEEVGETSREEAKELEEALCNKRVQEGAADWVPFVEECHGGAERAVWMEDIQQGELAEADEMEKEEKAVMSTEDQQGEPDMLTTKEGSDQTMLGRTETQEELGSEAKPWKRSNQWEPSGELEEVGETSRWKRELEDTSWKEQVQEEAVDWVQTVEEHHGSLQKKAWAEGFQNEGLEQDAKEVERVQLEAEEKQEEIVGASEDQQGQPDTLAEKEELQQAMLCGAEIGEGQEVELEGEKDVRRNHQLDVQDAVCQEKGLEETLWDRVIQGRSQLVEEEQRRLGGAAWSGGLPPRLMESCDEMVESNQLEMEEEKEEELEAEKIYQEEPDVTAEKEGLQQPMRSQTETGQGQEEEMGEKEETARNHQWVLKGKAEEAEGSPVGLEREQEGWSSNKEVQQGESYPVQFVGEEQRGLEGAMGSEGFQQGWLQEGTKITESPQLEATKEEEEGMAVKGVNQQATLSGAELERGHHVVVEEAGRNQQHQGEETELLEDQDRKPKVANTREGHQGGSEELERHQEGETEETERNRVDVKGEEEKAQTGDTILETDQREESERLADASGLEEEVLDESKRDPEKAERSQQPESVAHGPSLEEDPLAEPRVFPTKVAPLNTSAQKERVLLRRKSSIRRAPSVKKVRSPAETTPQEMQRVEDTPPLPPAQASSRPAPRHSGFGPMRPNMMAELQMRLRKPQ